MVMIRQTAFVCLAYTSKYDSKDQNKQTYRTVDIFADWNKFLCKFFIPAGVDLLFNIFFATYPEEHNSGKPCAERTDVDGQNIHPV